MQNTSKATQTADHCGGDCRGDEDASVEKNGGEKTGDIPEEDHHHREHHDPRHDCHHRGYCHNLPTDVSRH